MFNLPPPRHISTLPTSGDPYTEYKINNLLVVTHFTELARGRSSRNNRKLVANWDGLAMPSACKPRKRRSAAPEKRLLA